MHRKFNTILSFALIVITVVALGNAFAEPVARGHVSYDKLSLTRGITIKSTPLENTQGTHEYVLLIKGGQVYEDGKVLSHDGYLIEDLTVLGWGKHISEHPLLQLQREPNSPQYVPTKAKVAVFASAGAENYYHWMFQILPRIKILKESGVNFDKFYFYKLDKPYQLESLKILGIEQADIIIGKPDHIIVASELVAPSIPIWPAKGKMVTPWVTDYLRSIFLTNLQQNIGKYPKKIFISRKKSHQRRVVNEEALMNMLSKKGYHRVFLEDYPVKEQAMMFAQAQSIIGVHGSGLANLIFCAPGTQAIEINPPEGHCGPYSSLAKTLKLSYQQLNSKAAGLTKEQLQKDDIIVPVETLQAMLN